MLLVGFAVALWCVARSPGRVRPNGARTTADEPQYLLSAISLGEDLDLDISDERATGATRDFHEVLLPIQEPSARDDGSRVSPHDPLLPALLAVPVPRRWLARRRSSSLAPARRACSPQRCSWVAVRRFAVPLRVAVAHRARASAVAAPLAVYAHPGLPRAAGRARCHDRDRRAHRRAPTDGGLVLLAARSSRCRGSR